MLVELIFQLVIILLMQSSITVAIIMIMIMIMIIVVVIMGRTFSGTRFRLRCKGLHKTCVAVCHLRGGFFTPSQGVWGRVGDRV